MLTPGASMDGRYHLSGRIATGGMGDVWKAEDTVLGRTVAVKALQPAMLEEPGFAERFRAEARVMATLNHPGVVQVYDYGESPLDGGGTIAYLVMEYIEGEPLHRVLAEAGRITPARVMDLIAQAAEALQAAHDRGIVHRDVKPGNLLVKPDGRLVLTDFGIARSALTGNLTQAGAVLGTASYLSPEQASGHGEITPASDVYSLGVVAYQCLAGQRPFEGDNPLDVAMRHMRDEPPPLPADVPDAVQAVVVRAMAKDVADRWPDARTMAEAARLAGAGESVTEVLGMAPAGATSVLPAAGGIRDGQYRRGAAAIPAEPGTRTDQLYPAQGGHPAQGGYPAGDHPAGRRRSRAGTVLGVAAALMALVLGGVLLAYLNNGFEADAEGPSEAKKISLQEDKYLGRPLGEVEEELKALNLVPDPIKKPQPGYRPGAVNDLDPATNLEQGDTVKVYYNPKRQQNDGGGNDDGNNDGGRNDDGNGDGGNDGDGDDGGGNPPPPDDPATSEPPPTKTPSPTPSDPSESASESGSNALAAPDDGQKDD